jgi:hypothetical protein
VEPRPKSLADKADRFGEGFGRRPSQVEGEAWGRRTETAKHEPAEYSDVMGI